MFSWIIWQLVKSQLATLMRNWGLGELWALLILIKDQVACSFTGHNKYIILLKLINLHVNVTYWLNQWNGRRPITGDEGRNDDHIIDDCKGCAHPTPVQLSFSIFTCTKSHGYIKQNFVVCRNWTQEKPHILEGLCIKKFLVSNESIQLFGKITTKTDP
jgi:hypothetical protein